MDRITEEARIDATERMWHNSYSRLRPDKKFCADTEVAYNDLGVREYHKCAKPAHDDGQHLCICGRGWNSKMKEDAAKHHREMPKFCKNRWSEPFGKRNVEDVTHSCDRFAHELGPHTCQCGRTWEADD